MVVKFDPILDELREQDEDKLMFVFDSVTERDAYFSANPSRLFEDVLIAIKDTTPPPTPGVRNYDFSKPYNSQYILTTF